jgi:cytoskeletal protein RodZ
LKREPDNALVKQFVPMLFQLCVFQDEAGANEESSSEEEDEEEDDDDTDDSDDDEEGSDEDSEPEPEPEPVEPAATMAHSARERRIAALAAAEAELSATKVEAAQFGTRAHSLGISRVGGPDLPSRPQTPAELADADRKDAELIRQVLMEAIVDDGQPVTKGEVERVGGAE